MGELVGLAGPRVSLTAISEEEASGISEFLTGECSKCLISRGLFHRVMNAGPNQIATRIAHWKSVCLAFRSKIMGRISYILSLILLISFVRVDAKF